MMGGAFLSGQCCTLQVWMVEIKGFTVDGMRVAEDDSGISPSYDAPGAKFNDVVF